MYDGDFLWKLLSQNSSFLDTWHGPKYASKTLLKVDLVGQGRYLSEHRISFVKNLFWKNAKLCFRVWKNGFNIPYPKMIYFLIQNLMWSFRSALIFL